MIEDWDETHVIEGAVEELIRGLRTYHEMGRLVGAALEKGKKTRPLILLLSCRAHGGGVDECLDAAVAVELAHSASLVHDDILDVGIVRRGEPSIPSLVGVEAAVLLGDFMIAKSVELISGYQSDVVKEFGEVGMRMAEGESIDVTGRKHGLSEDEYFESIGGKTAALIATSASIGARIAGASDADRRAIRGFAEEVGLAYQVVDDLIEYLGKNQEKRSERRAMTLPEIYAERGLDPVEECEEKIRELLGRAKPRIKDLRAAERDKLYDLADYITLDMLRRTRS